MGLEDLKFKDVGNDLTAQIDNETQSLPVKDIIKFKTEFFNNKNLNTVINSPIDVDLSLIYIDEDETNPIDKGLVLLKMVSLSGQTTYFEEMITFKNGIIQKQLPNMLSIGEYKIEVNYFGDMFFEPTSISLQFKITKRLIKWEIDTTEVIQGYPNEMISVGIKLYDYLNDKKISNCIVNYTFNHFEYVTQTNENGYALLTFQMPDIDPQICPQASNTPIIQNIETNESLLNNTVFYFDDNGIIKYTNPNRTEFSFDSNFDYIPVFINEDIAADYENEKPITENFALIPTYPLEINIDSTVYQSISKENINVLLKQFQTNVNYNTQVENSTITINGNVSTENNNNVKYGKINFDIGELSPHPYKEAFVDEDGIFNFNVQVVQTESANKDPTLPTLFSIPSLTYTTVSIIGDKTISRDYVNKHKIKFKAEVKLVSSDEPVKYGMVTFVITKEEKEVYRYITELNNFGEAFFNFDVSTIGIYKVMAEYSKMFEYTSSKSEKETYEIVEG